jgi:hypothetical protein
MRRKLMACLLRRMLRVLLPACQMRRMLPEFLPAYRKLRKQFHKRKPVLPLPSCSIQINLKVP